MPAFELRLHPRNGIEASATLGAPRPGAGASRGNGMHKRWGVLGVFGVLACGAASAEGLLVRASDLQGRPVADAVVTIQPRTAVPRPARRAPQLRIIDQKNLMFVPYMQLLRPGDSVVFRNSDGTRHHVYSFSPAKAFEFMLKPGTSSPPLVLDKPGLIAVGCNIHDHMIAYLLVSPEQAQVTPPQGQVVFAHLPPGRYTVKVWHPQLRPGETQPNAVETVAGEGDTQQAAFTLSLMPDPRGFADREHLDY